MKYFLLPLFCFLFGKEQPQYIDGVAAVIRRTHNIKKRSCADGKYGRCSKWNRPIKDEKSFLRLQNSVLQSMVDQKNTLEMADIDSITVEKRKLIKA